MDLQLAWHKPVRLVEQSEEASYIYKIDLEKVPACAGIYIFARKFGSKLSPLYVGRAGKIRGRVKQHLNAVRLMKGIQNEAIGKRFVVCGEFVPRPGQKASRCLPLIEKALIRHFLSEGHDLLNKSGTNIAKHSLTSDKVVFRFLPRTILFE